MRPKTVCFAFLVGLGCVLWATRGQHGHNLGPKMESKSHKSRYQHRSKSIKIPSHIHEKSILGASWGPRPFILLFWWVLGAFCGPQEANIAPTWVPRWSPNRLKINAKMKAKNRCVLDGHIKWFFQILGANLAPKWRQVGHRKRIVVKFNWKGRKPQKVPTFPIEF